MCSLPFTTGAKPIFLSGFNRRARTGSHRKNLIFAPCAAYHGVFYACTFGGFCAILQKTARLSHTVLLLQLIPARGRKPSSILKLNMPLKLQLIPARGRKLPRLGVLHAFLGQVSTYPREGTETVVDQLFIPVGGFNLSPRGDGNVNCSLYACIVPCFNLSPRGGGNRSKPSTSDGLYWVSTYPREGTETNRISLHCS